jgi:hypothetical protein
MRVDSTDLNRPVSEAVRMVSSALRYVINKCRRLDELYVYVLLDVTLPIESVKQ